MIKFNYRSPFELLGASVPYLDVVMRGKNESVSIERCLVDSGADHNIFNDSWANISGIDLISGQDLSFVKLPQFNNIEGVLVKVKYILDNYEWMGDTVFIDWPKPIALLGRIGFFDAFDITFKQNDNLFSLTPTHATEVDGLKH